MGQSTRARVVLSPIRSQKSLWNSVVGSQHLYALHGPRARPLPRRCFGDQTCGRSQNGVLRQVSTGNGRTRPGLRDEVRWRSGYHAYFCECSFACWAWGLETYRLGPDAYHPSAQSGLFSAVASAFIIDVQSELKPNYEEMNNTLLEMLLNATTGTLPADSATPVPRWTGPDPVIVQAQCILYAALSVALLASLLAMLGKQWLNRYRQSETHGSTADRSRARERKLNAIETWKFRLVMQSLPLILQCALVLLGFALSRYLWGINRSVSSVVIGFTSFGFLFYLLLVTVSIFSFDCPFQTPFSAIRFVIDLAIRYWRSVRQTFGPKQQPPQPRTPGGRRDLPFSVKTVGREDESEASTTAFPCIAPDVIQTPGPIAPLFVQEEGVKEDILDARCITLVSPVCS